MRDKFSNDEELAGLTPSELVTLLTHYTLFAQEPVGNLQSRNS